MCLTVFSYKQHPDFDLIFAANRDENHERPTRAAQFWPNHSNILAGKDLKAGGTWMGITKEGSFAALTNYRGHNIEKVDPPSRGHLVLDYLKKNGDPQTYLENIDGKADEYMGFNILAGSVNQLSYYSNRQKEIQLLDAGLYGLSNHLLDTPWPKVRRAKNRLQIIIEDTTVSEEALFGLLADVRQADEGNLPDTGLPKEIEKKVSSIFIKSEGYGTRCSTVLLIDTEGNVTFIERRFKAGTLAIEDESKYQFSIKEYQTSSL